MKYSLIYLTAFLVILSFWNDLFAVIALITLILLILCTVTELIVEIDACVRGGKGYKQFFKTSKLEMMQISIVLGAVALTYFMDIFFSISMVGKVLLQTKEKE